VITPKEAHEIATLIKEIIEEVHAYSPSRTHHDPSRKWASVSVEECQDIYCAEALKWIKRLKGMAVSETASRGRDEEGSDG